MTRKFEDIGSDLLNFDIKQKNVRSFVFCIALVESNDTSDTAQILIVIRGMKNSFFIVKEPVGLKGLHGTTGEDLVFCVWKQ
jgi:hypothetical protein